MIVMNEFRLRFRSMLYGSKYRAILVIVLGIYFLLHNFQVIPDSWDIGQLWPLLLIVPATIFLVSSKKK